MGLEICLRYAGDTGSLQPTPIMILSMFASNAPMLWLMGGLVLVASVVLVRGYFSAGGAGATTTRPQPRTGGFPKARPDHQAGGKCG